MPTVTSLSQYTFHNVGPLTTTFTAPASCASTSNIAIAMSRFPENAYYYTDCASSSYGNCLPSTTEAPSTMALDDPMNAWQPAYYSPGLFCPAGWATVGIAARSGNGSVSATGLFNPFPSSTPTVPPYLPIFNDPRNVLLQILDPSETAVICCPSSMTPGVAGCYSTVPSYNVTSGCQRVFATDDLGELTTTFKYYGATVSGVVLTETGTDPVTPHTAVFTDPTPYIGVELSPLLTLIHQPSDTQAVSAGKTSSSAAKSLGPVPGSWGHISPILGVWVIGMAAGAVLIRPW